MIEVTVIYKPDSDTASRIRSLFCNMYAATPEAGVNPLTETKFNAMLAEIAQEAFLEGRRYQHSNPKMPVNQ